MWNLGEGEGFEIRRLRRMRLGRDSVDLEEEDVPVVSWLVGWLINWVVVNLDALIMCGKIEIDAD
ncbi:hypothetical protein LINPERPRIM_LOCUS5128 [Linum perenne]